MKRSARHEPIREGLVTKVECYVMRRWYPTNLILGALLGLVAAAVTVGAFALLEWWF